MVGVGVAGLVLESICVVRWGRLVVVCRAYKHRHRECLTPPYLFRMGAWVQRRTSSSRQASLYNNTHALPRFRPRKRVTPYFLLFVYIWWMNTRTTGLAVLVLLSSSSNQNLTRIQPASNQDPTNQPLLRRPWSSFYTERGYHSSLRPSH